MNATTLTRKRLQTDTASKWRRIKSIWNGLEEHYIVATGPKNITSSNMAWRSLEWTGRKVLSLPLNKGMVATVVVTHNTNKYAVQSK